MSDISLSPPKLPMQWLRIYRLYRSAFPTSERKPFFIIARMYRSKKTDLWCIHQRGRFCGFAATVNSPSIILLDYLAIAPASRNEGIGTAVLSLLKERYPEKGLFVEIESTDTAGDDLPQRLRRKHFYQNAGMAPMQVKAEVFGVPMELMGWNCTMDFDQYRSFYRDHYSPWAAEHILPPVF